MGVGPPIEQDIWQKYQGQDVEMLGLDVYNGSAQQVDGFRQLTGITFPLLLRASNGTNYGAGREYLMVIDREGTVRISINGASESRRQRIIDMIETTLAESVSPELSLGGNANFGSAVFGQTVSQTVSVQNTGAGTLSVSDVLSSSEFVSVMPTTFEVAPGGSQEITVTFDVQVKGDIAATLNLVSNASGNHVIDVSAQVPNAVPMAVNDTIRLAPNERVNVSVLQNDIDADGDSLVVQDVSQGQNSERVVINTDQTVHYRSEPNFVGIDMFTYTVDDGWGGSAMGTVVIIYEAPEVVQPTETDVSVGDFDGNGAIDFSDFVLFAQAFGSMNATFDLNDDGIVSFPDFLIFGGLFTAK